VKLGALIQRLEAKQAAWAASALASPAGESAFEYGRAVGVYAGLDMAKTLINDVLSDQEQKDFDL
jgi:hypothetical protein